MQLSVREIQTSDIKNIADYWLCSDPQYLTSLGVDLDKLPSRSGLRDALEHQIATPYPDKKAYALIMERDGTAIGHTNVNPITFGEEAFIHLHIWNKEDRRKGLGLKLIPLALPYFFKNLQLNRLLAEPYADNPAPNRILSRLGYTFVKSYRTTPGSLNFEQDVIRWELTKDDFESLY